MKNRKREIPGHVTVENHRRAVFLPSEIDITAYEKIAPEIIRLRLENSDPICLFIHCWGGVPFIAESILRLIRAPRQDGERCLVTTVCIGVAASAAADLLAAGDYAIAYADSTVHCHGTREKHNELTVENIPQVEAGLREENEYFAMKLASRMFRRFATQALLLEVFKTDPPSTNVVAVGAEPSEIQARIANNVAPQHGNLIGKAVERADRIRKLFEYVKSGLADPKTDPITSDSMLLKQIVDFETNSLQARKSAGEIVTGFTPLDVDLIQDDFFNLKELLSGSYQKQALELSHQKGHYFLSLDEVREYRKIKPEDEAVRYKFLEEKASPKIFPLWYLVVSLCRLLQKGENEFTASDAWYFGLVDEVTGTNLPSVRKWRLARTATEKTLPPANSSASPNATSPPGEQSPPAD